MQSFNEFMSMAGRVYVSLSIWVSACGGRMLDKSMK